MGAASYGHPEASGKPPSGAQAQMEPPSAFAKHPFEPGQSALVEQGSPGTPNWQDPKGSDVLMWKQSDPLMQSLVAAQYWMMQMRSLPGISVPPSGSWLQTSLMAEPAHFPS